VVVATKDDSNRGGPDHRFEGDANHVLIQHSDGTIGNYAHLTKNSVHVNVGQEVQPGDLLGYSGNTGFSSGPHLHFCVFKTKSGKERESIPIQFATSKGLGTLQYGESYSAAKTLVVTR
jgi:murein DD-endopeptidase MepM/ murein hydrolase activator NlpD